MNHRRSGGGKDDAGDRQSDSSYAPSDRVAHGCTSICTAPAPHREAVVTDLDASGVTAAFTDIYAPNVALQANDVVHYTRRPPTRLPTRLSPDVTMSATSGSVISRSDRHVYQARMRVGAGAPVHTLVFNGEKRSVCALSGESEARFTSSSACTSVDCRKMAIGEPAEAFRTPCSIWRDPRCMADIQVRKGWCDLLPQST